MGDVRVGRVEDFPVNTCRVISLPTGEPVMVINLGGELHALEGRCGAGGRLHEPAEVVESEGRVLCPWHGWDLDLERGICSACPESTLKRFPVRLEGGNVLLSYE